MTRRKPYTPLTVDQLHALALGYKASIERNEARMATCKPRSRFAYASQITKARGKLARAERELAEYGRYL